MSEPTNSASGNRTRGVITLERSYRATIADVWELWTTKTGIESWWGPEGFAVTVRELDLRVGGEMLYTMTATAPDQIDFMTRAGMPLATDVAIEYTEIESMHRLGYRTSADFVPGVEPYPVSTTVTLEPTADVVRMVLTFDAMHDDEWTQRAVMGHESELAKLERILPA